MKKSTIIVFGLVVALGLIYFFTKEDRLSVGVKKMHLPTINSDQVDHVEIDGKERVVLHKEGDEWELTIGTDEQPKKVAADSSNVTSMIDAAMSLRASHYVTNMKDKYDELGLGGDSVTTVKLFHGDEVMWALLLGNNASGSGRYAKTPDDDDVYVVRGSFWQLLRNGPTDWRNREILSVKDSDIKAFKMQKAKKDFVSLQREDDNSWAFDKNTQLPRGFRPKQSSLSALVRAGLELRASGFVDKDIRLTTPSISIHVETDEKPYDVDIYPGKDEDQYLVKRGDVEQIYEISKYNFDRLNKSLDDLRDLSVLRFDKNSIQEVRLRHGKKQVVIDKKEDQWRIVEPKVLPEGFEFDPASVDDMLAMLTTLSGKRLASPNKDAPQDRGWQKNWWVELISDNKDKIQFYLGRLRSNPEQYLAKGNIDQEIYVVQRSQIALLEKGIDAFKKEEFELPPIDERTKGFDSLPVDVQRKLLKGSLNKK